LQERSEFNKLLENSSDVNKNNAIEEEILGNEKYKRVIKRLEESDTPSDKIDLVKKAFRLCVTMHGSQKRASGEPYYDHPFSVAEILLTLNADCEMLAAGLLHDVLEDTEYPPEKLQQEFGETVLLMVDSVTKLNKFSFSSKEEQKAENFRRMFIAMAKDIRVVVIKLADRLHNMRTLNHMPEYKQIRTAKETLEIFAPLANRLGIGRIKWELEDMALRYMNPEAYWKITKSISQKRDERENYIYRIINELNQEIIKYEIPATITGRPKHFYSIYQKMVQQNKDLNEIYDLIALRIKVGDGENENVYDTNKETNHDISLCYEILGIVHSLWKPVPGRFKDYIAMPKPNLYQSLHTTVIGFDGVPLEIQIRTNRMDKIAEYGIAAHWQYKEKQFNQPIKQNQANLQFSWLRQLLEWQNDLQDANEFLNTVKVDLFADEVFVFSPKGEVYVLPQGSNSIDFAYRVHTEVGHRCVGAKINGKIVPLNAILNNGDQIEILTSKVSQPSLDWVNFVTTPHAKHRIRQWFKKEKRSDNIRRGHDILDAEMLKANLNDIENKIDKLEDVAKKLNQVTFDDLLAAIGYGEISSIQVISRLKSELPPKPEDELKKVAEKRVSKHKLPSNILVGGVSGLLIAMASCCSPIPGEDICGVVTRGKGILVHCADCPNLVQVNQERVVEASWGNVENNAYPVGIEIRCLDTQGLLSQVINKVSESKINILGANVSVSKDKTGIIDLVIEVPNLERLKKIMFSISCMSDVLNVSKIKRIKKTSAKDKTEKKEKPSKKKGSKTKVTQRKKQK